MLRFLKGTKYYFLKKNQRNQDEPIQVHVPIVVQFVVVQMCFNGLWQRSANFLGKGLVVFFISPSSHFAKNIEDILGMIQKSQRLKNYRSKCGFSKYQNAL